MIAPDSSVVIAALAPWHLAHRACLGRAVERGVRGGALYDALIAATAARHGADLLSADERARPTYEAMGVEAVFIGT